MHGMGDGVMEVRNRVSRTALRTGYMPAMTGDKNRLERPIPGLRVNDIPGNRLSVERPDLCEGRLSMRTWPGRDRE